MALLTTHAQRHGHPSRVQCVNRRYMLLQRVWCTSIWQAPTDGARTTCSKSVRKSIACVLTVISHNQREALREVAAKKKYMPLDLRLKKTRAIRRALSPQQVRAAHHAAGRRCASD